MTTHRATGALLWLRAGLLGAIALLTGIVSHASADGLLPSAAWLAVLGLGATLSAAWVLRRRVSAAGLLGLAVLGQTITHLALTVLAGHRGDPVTRPAHAVAGGTWEDAMMGGYADPPAAPSLGWTTHLVDHMTEIGPGMVLAHLLGALALAGWLAMGEAALWGLLLLLGADICAWLVAWTAPLVPLAPAPARADVPLAAPRRWVLCQGNVSRRGPPLPVC